MLKFFYAPEKTNSFRPTPWHLSEDPFPGIRGGGARYSVFLAIARNFRLNISSKTSDQEILWDAGIFLGGLDEYIEWMEKKVYSRHTPEERAKEVERAIASTPWENRESSYVNKDGSRIKFVELATLENAQSAIARKRKEETRTLSDGYICPTLWEDKQLCKVVVTANGGLLLVPCPQEEDERIGLITMRGGFRGSLSIVESKDTDTLVDKSGNMHCCPTRHLLVRFLSDEGFIASETGRRCGTGQVEIYSWKDGYKTMRSEEFSAFKDYILLE